MFPVRVVLHPDNTEHSVTLATPPHEGDGIRIVDRHGAIANGTITEVIHDQGTNGSFETIVSVQRD